MPELSERYFGFPTGNMIECTYSGIMTAAEKFLKNISQMKLKIIFVQKYVK